MGVSPSDSLIQGLSKIDLLDCFGALGFSLFELGEFPEGISILGRLCHSVHEQINAVRLVFEIIEWFKVVKAVHELIKFLVE